MADHWVLGNVMRHDLHQPSEKEPSRVPDCRNEQKIESNKYPFVSRRTCYQRRTDVAVSNRSTSCAIAQSFDDHSDNSAIQASGRCTSIQGQPGSNLLLRRNGFRTPLLEIVIASSD